jgi:hypothetical protein
VAWTKEEIVVFGGEALDKRSRMVNFLNDGVAYNPTTGRWRELSAAPFEPSLLDVSATWTGQELLVIGVPCESYVGGEDEGPACIGGPVAMAAFSPSRDTWRDIDVPTTLKGGYRSPATIGRVGSEVIFDFGKEYWAYSARTNDWRRVPDPPFAPRKLCVAGDRLTAVGFDDRVRWQMDRQPPPQPGLSVTIPPPPADLRVSLRASVLDSQANAWSPVVTPSDSTRAPEVLNVLCSGPYVLALGSGRPPILVRFDLASRAWSTLARPTAEVGVDAPITWTGDRALVWGYDSVLAYAPLTNAWTAIRSSLLHTPRQVFWVGDRAVVWDDSTAPEFSTYVP